MTVIRPLLVQHMVKLPRVKPWIIRDDDVTVIDGEYIQTPEELDEYKQFSNCINCMYFQSGYRLCGNVRKTFRNW